MADASTLLETPGFLIVSSLQGTGIRKNEKEAVFITGPEAHTAPVPRGTRDGDLCRHQGQEGWEPAEGRCRHVDMHEAAFPGSGRTF